MIAIHAYDFGFVLARFLRFLSGRDGRSDIQSQFLQLVLEAKHREWVRCDVVMGTFWRSISLLI